jgi:hypothetical protein
MYKARIWSRLWHGFFRCHSRRFDAEKKVSVVEAAAACRLLALMALIKLSTLVTGGDSCFCNGQTLTTIVSEYQDSSCDRLRNIDAVMECRIVSTQMVPTSTTAQNLCLTFFDTIPPAAAAGRNLFGAAKCKREPILELDIGRLCYIPQKPLARSLARGIQEQDQHHGRSTPRKHSFPNQ